MGKILNHQIKRVDCRRFTEDISKYNLGYHFDIPERRLENGMLKIDYAFTIYYRDNIGEVVVEGSLDYKDTAKKLKELDKKWNENKDVQKKIYNLIFRNAVTLVLDLTRHVGLPSPIFMPEIEPGNET